MTLTPRQAYAYVELSRRLDRIDLINDMMVTHVAAQGDKDSINKALHELNSIE